MIHTQGYWVIRTYTSGDIGEKIKYWVPGEKPPRSKRKIKSDIKKMLSNERAAKKRVARLIHANFGTGVLISLDYSDAGLASIVPSDGDRSQRDAAEHALHLFLRRVRYECDKRGIECRYIAITSDMNGKTGDPVRIHHHLVVSTDILDICRSKWTLGGVSWSYLDKAPDKTGLAHYLMAQVERMPDERKYTASRNLYHPQPVDRVALSGSEIRAPKGADLLHRSAYYPGLPQYIRYVIPQGRRKTEE